MPDKLRRVWTHLAYPEALADYEEAISLRDHLPAEDTANSPQLLRLMAQLTKARLGDDSRLARLGEQARITLKEKTGMQPIYWMTYFDAACVHAVLAQVALNDHRKPLRERQQLAQRDLDRGLELLDRSRATGEFKGMIRLDEVCAIRRLSCCEPIPGSSS